MALFPTGGPTPRTPEILNSLMSMTNPFDAWKHEYETQAAHQGLVQPVHHTRSQLIKEGLKLQLQSRRRSSSVVSPPSPDSGPLTPNGDALTPEDEERRRRRRERNKIAATKCRIKKREKTYNLVHESEILETQNTDLKTQIQDLECEKQKLVDILSVHKTNCPKASPSCCTSEYSSGYSQSRYCSSQFSKHSQVQILCETTISYRKDSAKESREDQRYSHQHYQQKSYPDPRFTNMISPSSSDSSLDNSSNIPYHNSDHESYMVVSSAYHS